MAGHPGTVGARRELPLNWAGAIVAALGACIGVAALFLPHLSSTQATFIKDNMLLQKDPLAILCPIVAIIGIARFVSVGSRRWSINVVVGGLAFLALAVYQARTGQLYSLVNTTEPVDTAAGSGLWAMGLGSAVVALGGMMMRFSWGNALLRTASAAVPVVVAQEKTCPKCAENVKAAALVCRYCGFSFPTSSADPGEAETADALEMSTPGGDARRESAPTDDSPPVPMQKGICDACGARLLGRPNRLVVQGSVQAVCRSCLRRSGA